MDFNPSRAARIDRSKRIEKKNRKFDYRKLVEDFDGDEDDLSEDQEDKFERE